MAIQKPNLAPSIKFTETDLTFTTRNFGITSLGISGEFPKGRAFTPVAIDNVTLFKQVFGDNNPCKFEGTQQPIYEGVYIAKQFLTESDQLFASRVLGLTGYDAGDAWGISFGAALDPATVATTSTSTFTATINYVNGSVGNVTFSNPVLQDLYDAGEIADALLGGSTLVTGDTVVVGNQFIGNCDTFTGARFNMTVTDKVETFICITGETSVGTSFEVPSEVQNCVVLYSGGTITYDSTFVITVVNPIVVQNVVTNELTVVPSGILTLVGGTITHGVDGSVVIESGSIFFPNGDVFTGGEYKICDLNDNVAVYDCDTIDGINYTLTTGTTIIYNTVTSGTTQQIVSQIPSGLVQIDFSGTVIELSGSAYAQYDNMVVALLRSFAEYNGDEVLNFQVEGNVISIESIDGGIIKPLDDFLIKGTKTDGSTFEFNVSFDKSKSNYILRVFGNFIPCCPNNLPLYVEDIFETTFNNLLANGLIYCIKPSMCYINTLNNYKEPYQGAMTPWIVSELRGNRVYRLFRIHTFSDGNAANTDIKVSITNIRPDAKTFDIQVRSYGDTDKKPVVLESYSRLTLREQDNNFIGRRIGTVDGNYVLNSKYIMIELAAECLDESFPAGFEGYPVRDYDCMINPQMIYKTQYAINDKVRQTYLGFNDVVGYDADFFDYKGKPANALLPYWTGTTHGFHLDTNASAVTVDGVGTVNFETGAYGFQNETDIVGTAYEKIESRKFTVLVFGGFDGWDIHRKTRTNTDLYTVNGSLGQKGLTSGAFDVYSSENINEGQTVINSDYYAYLEGIRSLRNRNEFRINLLATPNVNTAENSNLVEEAIDMCENERCDTFYVTTTLDTDASGQVLLPNDAVSIIQDLYNSSYAATYFPWGQFLDEVNNVYLWLPPTAEVMRIFALTDKIRRPWFAGAGFVVGETQFKQARKKLRQDEMDVLYEGRINPISTFRQADGTSPVFVFGNKTLQIAESALDRINVRRLLLYAQRLIEDVSLPLLFDQNDETVRRKFENKVNPILANIRNERGIFAFEVQLDRSNEAFNSNEMKGKIGIQPTRTLEYINIEFVLTPAGASFQDI
jgi:hypothetical protein